MMNNATVFDGCIPALMTPWTDDGPDYDTLVTTATGLIEAGMSAVVYCGSMGDWPLLPDDQRQRGVEALVTAGIPTVVGTGAASPAAAVEHARHAAATGAHGLMVIPRVLSRGSSAAAQRLHLAAVLAAAPDIPAVIYNSPYYGFQTGAELFFELRAAHPNLVGFKEFGGRASLSYAAEFITSGDRDLRLLVGVDTEVVHGVVECGATGVITGIGNVFPGAVLELFRLSGLAAAGQPDAHAAALQLERALAPMATFDEGPDLVLYFRHLMVMRGHSAYARPVWDTDALSPSQLGHATAQFERFQRWRQANHPSSDDTRAAPS